MTVTLPVYGDPIYTLQPSAGFGATVDPGSGTTAGFLTTGMLDTLVVTVAEELPNPTTHLFTGEFRAHRVNSDGSVTTGAQFDFTQYSGARIAWVAPGVFVAYGYWNTDISDAGLRVDLFAVDASLNITLITTRTRAGLDQNYYSTYHPDLGEVLFLARHYDTGSSNYTDLNLFRVPVSASAIGAFPSMQTISMTGIAPKVAYAPLPLGPGTYWLTWTTAAGIGNPYYAAVVDPVAGTVGLTTVDSFRLTDPGPSPDRPRNVVLDAYGADLHQITIADNGTVSGDTQWTGYTGVCNAYLDALGLGAPGELQVDGVVPPQWLTWNASGQMVLIQRVWKVNLATDDWTDTPLTMVITDPVGTPRIDLYRTPGMADSSGPYDFNLLGDSGGLVVAEVLSSDGGTTVSTAPVERLGPPTVVWGKVKPDSGTKVIKYTAAAPTPAADVNAGDLLVSAPYEQGSGPNWHGLESWNVTEWDGSTVVVCYTQTDTNTKRSLRAITTDDGGVLTAHPELVAAEDIWPTSTIDTSNTPFIRRVGDMVVYLEPGTGHLHTFTMDPTTKVLTKIDETTTQTFPGLTPPGGTGAGQRFVPWGSAGTDLLLVLSYHNSGTARGHMCFAHWNGTTWLLGSDYVSPDSTFGSQNYQQVVRMDDTHAIVISEVGGSFAATHYDVVTGSYPAAPTVTRDIATGYYNNYDTDEIHEGSVPGTAIRQVPLSPGTTTPESSGGNWDYGYVTLSLDGSGAVVQSDPAVPYSATMNSHDGYDSVISQTTDDEVWTATSTWHSSDTDPSNVLKIHRAANPISEFFSVTQSAPDGGIKTSEMRYSARAGKVFVVGYRTQDNWQFRLVSVFHDTGSGDLLNSLTLHGPSTADQGDSNRHKGKFALDPTTQNVSCRLKVGTTDRDIWVQPIVKYFAIGADSSVVPMGSTPLPVLAVTAAPQWREVNHFLKAPQGVTHYSVEVDMFADAALTESLPGGTRVYFDSIFVPDSGYDLRDGIQPYLDGDQSFGIWEGTPENSTSIYGTKPVVVIPPVLDYDLAVYDASTSTPTTPDDTSTDPPPPPPPPTEP